MHVDMATPLDTVCLGVIPHEGDCTWDIKWKPASTTTSDHPHAQNPADGKNAGTFAAALGDGTVLICALTLPSPHSSSSSLPHTLPCTKSFLRKNPARTRTAIHRIQWCPTGTRLMVGCADGSVEVYETKTSRPPWAHWCVPAQESAIADMRFLSTRHVCTLGKACVLRVCDVRDPVAIVEQNAEGLSGSMSMCVLEEGVAIVGGDTGYLRVVRLGAGDGFAAKVGVRRVHLQGSGFRDMKGVDVDVGDGKGTAVYTGGSEGVLHEVVLPRPVWTSEETCEISRLATSHKARWLAVEGGLCEAGLEVCVGEGVPVAERRVAVAGNVMKVSKTGKKYRKRRGFVGRELVGSEGALFGDAYEQKVVVTRIAISPGKDRIAFGIHGGFVTCIPFSHADSFLHEERRRSTRKDKKKCKMGGERRGRARKEGKEDACVETGVKEEGGVDVDEDVGNEAAEEKIVKTEASMDVEREAKKDGKKEAKKETKLPVFGPKRKRGRPRKQAVEKAAPKKKRRAEGMPRKRGRPRKADMEAWERAHAPRETGHAAESGVGVCDVKLRLRVREERRGMCGIVRENGGDGAVCEVGAGTMAGQGAGADLCVDEIQKG